MPKRKAASEKPVAEHPSESPDTPPVASDSTHHISPKRLLFVFAIGLIILSLSLYLLGFQAGYSEGKLHMSMDCLALIRMVCPEAMMWLHVNRTVETSKFPIG